MSRAQGCWVKYQKIRWPQKNATSAVGPASQGDNAAWWFKSLARFRPMPLSSIVSSCHVFLVSRNTSVFFCRRSEGAYASCLWSEIPLLFLVDCDPRLFLLRVPRKWAGHSRQHRPLMRDLGQTSLSRPLKGVLVASLPGKMQVLLRNP